MDIWSDIHCPWALITLHRLRAVRQQHALQVVFAPRAWPLEWVNRRGTPREIVTTETADSKDPRGPVLAFSPPAWRRFAAQAKADA